MNVYKANVLYSASNTNKPFAGKFHTKTRMRISITIYTQVDAKTHVPSVFKYYIMHIIYYLISYDYICMLYCSILWWPTGKLGFSPWPSSPTVDMNWIYIGRCKRAIGSSANATVSVIPYTRAVTDVPQHIDKMNVCVSVSRLRWKTLEKLNPIIYGGP